MRQHITIKVPQYARLINVGIDAAYEDIRQGNIDSIKVGQRKLRIPVAAVEARLGGNPGELDHLIDEMERADG